MEILKQAPWSIIMSVQKETIAVSDKISIHVQKRHSRILLRALLRGRMREMRREPEVLEAEAQVEECLDCRARITSKELAPVHSVKNGILQNACSTCQKKDADLGKRSKNNGDKSAVALLKKTRQLGCVFQDMEPPKSSSILLKSSNILKPIRCVRFTEAVLRHANIRDQNPSLGMICPGDPHQRNPNAPKFGDRPQEETEWQELCAREAAWRLAKNILKLKEKHKTTFFSPSENWCLPAPSNLESVERELVVDSGASMHMLSRKDMNSAELETVVVSESSTTVVAASGEVQTKEEATVYAKELDLFVTVKLLEDTPAILSLGKLCEDHGYSNEWTSGRNPQLI